jgi:hypothetical protein
LNLLLLLLAAQVPPVQTADAPAACARPQLLLLLLALHLAPL